ncbi:sugar-transfer associated ATP-grasp domain-containing protein [Sulfurimonas sp.]
MLLKKLKETLTMLHNNKEMIVGMNKRNLDFVYPNNPRKSFEYANNKILTKRTLAKQNINIPKTFLEISYFFELNEIDERLQNISSFVIKPSSGSGGNGILVIGSYEDGKWKSISNKTYTLEMIKKHIADIIFGVYSFGLNDTAIIEERIVQECSIAKLSPLGLADIRMINHKNKNIAAMLRIATKASDGKANLHQGGIGVCIDIESGETMYAQIQREDIQHHPDTGVKLTGVVVPFWDDIKRLCIQTSHVIPLGYLGIDIALGENKPLILEVNARPGIEIQNVSHFGLLERLQ